MVRDAIGYIPYIPIMPYSLSTTREHYPLHATCAMMWFPILSTPPLMVLLVGPLLHIINGCGLPDAIMQPSLTTPYTVCGREAV